MRSFLFPEDGGFSNPSAEGARITASPHINLPSNKLREDAGVIRIGAGNTSSCSGEA